MCTVLQVHADDMQLQIQTFALDVRLHELPVEEVGVCLRAGENMGDAYLKINPLHKVPFLLDGDYGLPESCGSATLLLLMVDGLCGSDTKVLKGEV